MTGTGKNLGQRRLRAVRQRRYVEHLMIEEREGGRRVRSRDQAIANEGRCTNRRAEALTSFKVH